MKALLKYKGSDEFAYIGEGDVLVSTVTDLGLTKENEYKVEEVKDEKSIVVVNDDGYRVVYDIDMFYRSWKTKEKESYVEVDVFVAEGDSVKHKVVSISEFEKMKKDKSLDIKLANVFIKNGDTAIGFKIDLNNIEFYN